MLSNLLLHVGLEQSRQMELNWVWKQWPRKRAIPEWTIYHMIWGVQLSSSFGLGRSWFALQILNWDQCKLVGLLTLVSSAFQIIKVPIFTGDSRLWSWAFVGTSLMLCTWTKDSVVKRAANTMDGFTHYWVVMYRIFLPLAILPRGVVQQPNNIRSPYRLCQSAI